ncbi:MAG: chorismate synthase [Planctomycetota bacterium]
MRARIDEARQAGDSLGGRVEVVACGCPPGLGSFAQWDQRLDGRLARALVSIQAIKAFAIGLGDEVADRPGSAVHDPILPGDGGPPRRGRNHAGGLEGGITNGEPLVLRATMKPISTLRQGLPSVDLGTGAPVTAAYERSDVCAVPAASVVAEAMTALVLADAALELLGGATLAALEQAAAAHLARIRAAMGGERA